MLTSETKDQSLHDYALELAIQYHRSESLLVKVLEEIDACRLYRSLGYSSLFSYSVSALGLSEARAYAMIAVARKARDLEPLKRAISSQELSVSKAAKIVAVLNQNNAAQIIEFAKTHTSREIELEVARQRTEGATGSGDGGKQKLHQLAVPTALYEKIRRAQSVLTTKRGKSIDRVKALEAVVDDFLHRHDPVRRADRAIEQERKKQAREAQQAQQAQQALEAERQYSAKPTASAVNSAREEQAQRAAGRVSVGDAAGNSAGRALGQNQGQNQDQNQGQNQDQADHTQSGLRRSHERKRRTAAENHAVNARDRGRCTFVGGNGQRCENDCWIHHHHKVPVSLGGSNDPKNLVSLCSFHHDLVHQLSFGIDGQVNWLKAPVRAYSYQ